MTRLRHDGVLPLISASDVGRYVYCARAWWLERVKGYAPQNTAALARGRARHVAHGGAVAGAARAQVLARGLWLLALILGLALVFTWLCRL